MNPFATLINQVAPGVTIQPGQDREARILELRQEGYTQQEIATMTKCGTDKVGIVLQAHGMNTKEYQQRQELLNRLMAPAGWRYQTRPGDKWTLADSRPRGLPKGAKVQRLYAPDDAA